MMMENIFVFPLKMHVGSPSIPIVKKKDLVKRGQCLAEANGLGAKIHSSVSGQVIKIDNDSIQILADEVQQEDYLKIKECLSIQEYVYEAGVVGAGGAGFPTHIKLQSQIPTGFVIANCIECEPLLSHNIMLLEERPELVVKGIKYTMKATKAPKAVIAIKKKNQKAIQAIRKVLVGSEAIEIKELPDVYPMGEERAVLHAIFGKWLAPSQLPIELGCIVINTETLANMTRAVEDRKPVIDKDITVGGQLVKGRDPQVFFSGSDRYFC